MNASSPVADRPLRPRVIAFDMDDTLVATFANGFAKVGAAAQQLGLPPLDLGAYAAAYGRLPFAECIAHWFSGVDVQAFERAYVGAGRVHPYQPLCDFGHLRSWLSARGVSVGILTNGTREKTRRKLATLDVAPESLDFVLCHEDLAAPKPDPQAVRAIFAVSGLPPDAHLYVGDSRSDLDACAGAGAAFVAVNSGPTQWLPGDAAYVVSNASGIKNLLATAAVS